MEIKKETFENLESKAVSIFELLRDSFSDPSQYKKFDREHTLYSIALARASDGKQFSLFSRHTENARELEKYLLIWHAYTTILEYMAAHPSSKIETNIDHTNAKKGMELLADIGSGGDFDSLSNWVSSSLKEGKAGDVIGFIDLISYHYFDYSSHR